MATKQVRNESSIGRALSILKLLSPEKPQLRAEEVMQHLDCSQASAYRYIDALSDIGLLSAVGGGLYGVGPRVIELDRTLRKSDPVIHVGQKIMRERVNQIPNSVLRLCGLFEDKVMCLHSEGPEKIKLGDDEIVLTLEKGVTMPLFQNAASLSILAYLPIQKAKNIYLENAAPINSAGLGGTWLEFKDYLADFKRRGFVYTVGKNNPRLAALSVPIVTETSQVFGSLSRVYPREWFVQQNLDELVREVASCGEAIRADIMNAKEALGNLTS